MLVITRKIGERLFVGSEIVITVTKITRNKVGLGIEAPPSVTVQREELLTKSTNGCDRQKAAIPLEDV